MPSLKDAIQWIADNDAPGDKQTAEEMEGYLTVCLVADLFEKDAAQVARRVWEIRNPQPKPKLIAASDSLIGVQVLIGRFYASQYIRTDSIGLDKWSVYNGSKCVPGVQVRLVKGRYRFERLG